MKTRKLGKTGKHVTKAGNSSDKENSSFTLNRCEFVMEGLAAAAAVMLPRIVLSAGAPAAQHAVSSRRKLGSLVSERDIHKVDLAVRSGKSGWGLLRRDPDPCTPSSSQPNILVSGHNYTRFPESIVRHLPMCNWGNSDLTPMYLCASAQNLVQRYKIA